MLAEQDPANRTESLRELRLDLGHLAEDVRRAGKVSLLRQARRQV